VNVKLISGVIDQPRSVIFAAVVNLSVFDEGVGFNVPSDHSLDVIPTTKIALDRRDLRVDIIPVFSELGVKKTKKRVDGVIGFFSVVSDSLSTHRKDPTAPDIINLEIIIENKVLRGTILVTKSAIISHTPTSRLGDYFEHVITHGLPPCS
jgi:hypothetical protein